MATMAVPMMVHITGDPPRSIDAPRPRPTALPTEKHKVTRKTPMPAITPTFLPRWSLIDWINDTGDLIPKRTLMSVRKIIRMVETTITQIRVYW